MDSVNEAFTSPLAGLGQLETSTKFLEFTLLSPFSLIRLLFMPFLSFQNQEMEI